MKIYDKLIIDISTGRVVEEDSFEYHGPIARCDGGGPGGASPGASASTGPMGLAGDPAFGGGTGDYSGQDPSQGFAGGTRGLPVRQAGTVVDMFGRASKTGRAIDSAANFAAKSAVSLAPFPGSLAGRAALTGANPPFGGYTPDPEGIDGPSIEPPKPTARADVFPQVKEQMQDTDMDRLVSQLGGDVDAYLESQEGFLGDLLETGLTPEEVASFEAQYMAELDALTAEHERLSGRQGASRLAELADRGVVESTTGERIMAEDQAEWTRMFTGAQSELEQTKLGAMEDFESAKKGLASAKYQLSSDMTQKQLDTALQASMSMQNYLLSKGGIGASTAFNQALMQQQQEKAKYDQRASLWNTVSGVGAGILKEGLSGIFS